MNADAWVTLAYLAAFVGLVALDVLRPVRSKHRRGRR